MLFQENSLPTYDLDYVINIDDTGSPRDSPNKTTLNAKGAKKVQIAC